MVTLGSFTDGGKATNETQALQTQGGDTESCVAYSSSSTSLHRALKRQPDAKPAEIDNASQLGGGGSLSRVAHVQNRRATDGPKHAVGQEAGKRQARGGRGGGQGQSKAINPDTAGGNEPKAAFISIQFKAKAKCTYES